MFRAGERVPSEKLVFDNLVALFNTSELLRLRFQYRPYIIYSIIYMLEQTVV